MIDLRVVSEQLETKISDLFEELRSGMSEREDSRAFGAMIERRITDNWDNICLELNYRPLPRPGRRTIFDFALETEGQIVGIDVKTKDLDTTSYSDGGICAVGNLLKYLANDNGVFLIAEFGHNRALVEGEGRDIEYIRVAPFIMLPQNAYRIENLGTGQVRLNYTLNQVWDEIAWDREPNEFYDLFIELAITHYRRVSRDAANRIEALERFRQNGYKNFSFGRGSSR
jgi:hypothetical protein